jgi:fibronectin-binding autotransporter adhesin
MRSTVNRRGRRGLIAVFAAVLALGAAVGSGPHHAAAAAKTWTGATSGNWSVGTNWVGGVAPVTGDNLVFPAGASNMSMTDDLPVTVTNLAGLAFTCTSGCYTVTGTTPSWTLNGNVSLTGSGGAQTVVFSEGLTLGASVQISVTDASAGIRFDGVIGELVGPFGITAVGPGTTVFNNNNTFTGGLTLDGPSAAKVTNSSGGTVTPFGTGTMTVGSGGRLGLFSSPVLANNFVVNGNGGAAGAVQAVGDATINGTINLATDTVLAQDTLGATFTLNGVISGAKLTLNAPSITAGFFSLTAANTYTGGTDVGLAGSTPIVQVTDNAAFGTGTVTVNTGATVALESGVTISNALSLSGFGANGNGALLPVGPGTETWSGPITLAAPNVTIGSLSGSDLVLTGVISGVGGGATFFGSGNVNLAGAASNTFTGAITVSQGNVNLNKSGGAVALSGSSTTIGGGAVASVTSNGNNEMASQSVSVFNHGTLDLNGNQQTGITALNLDGNGTVDSNGGGLLGLAGDVTSTVVSPGPAFIGTLVGNGGSLDLGAAVRTFTVADGAAAQDLQIAAGVTNTGGVIKAGPGTMEMSGTNLYTGTTTVNAGTLLVDGATTGSDATVNSGATIGGTGSLHNLTSVAGTVSPGDAGPGIFSVNNLALDNLSSFTAELNGTSAGTGYDQLSAGGSVALGGATLNASFGFTPAAGDTFTIVNNTGVGAVNGTFAGLVEGAQFAINGNPVRISYLGGTGNDVVLTALAGFSTTTTLASSLNPSASGQSVTFTATVTPGTAGTPTGTVQFFDGSTLLATVAINSSGVATFTTSTLSVGRHNMTATYSGDGSFSGSTSAVLAQVVTGIPVPTTGAHGAIPGGVLLVLGGLWLGGGAGRRPRRRAYMLAGLDRARA